VSRKKMKTRHVESTTRLNLTVASPLYRIFQKSVENAVKGGSQMSLVQVRFRREVGAELKGRTLAGTGHRPNRLGYGADVASLLVGFAQAWLSVLAPMKVISGMALGWDQALATAAVELGIPFVAAVPFAGQEARWPVESQRAYDALIAQAAEVVIVSRGGFSARAMQARNEWMTDRADLLVALYDGTPSGTGNSIRYAERTGTDVLNLWESWGVYRAAKLGAGA